MMGVKINLDFPRTLLYTLAAYRAVEAKLRIPREALGQELNKAPGLIRADVLATVIWAGLLDEDPELSLGYIKGLVGNLGPRDRKRLVRAMKAALKVSLRDFSTKAREVTNLAKQAGAISGRLAELAGAFTDSSQPKLTTVGKRRR